MRKAKGSCAPPDLQGQSASSQLARSCPSGRPATATTPKDTGCCQRSAGVVDQRPRRAGLQPRRRERPSERRRPDLRTAALTSTAEQDCEAAGGCTVPIIYYFSDNRLTPAH